MFVFEHSQGERESAHRVFMFEHSLFTLREHRVFTFEHSLDTVWTKFEQSVFSVHTECSRLNTLRERGRARERDSGPARPRRHQPAGPFLRPPANTPALHQDTHTNTAGETRPAAAPGAAKTLREPQTCLSTLEAQQIGLLPAPLPAAPGSSLLTVAVRAERPAARAAYTRAGPGSLT